MSQKDFLVTAIISQTAHPLLIVKEATQHRNLKARRGDKD
jgi:hypothetical protein